jgi:DNA modification methylase
VKAHIFRTGDAFKIGPTLTERFPLILCDAPYGRILRRSWDVAQYGRWMTLCSSLAQEAATICMWGGIGKHGHRPFLHFAATVEADFPEWTIANWITWRKKRAYGVQRNYLFTREECLILTRGTPTFNIPYLAQERGYDGYNKDYPAKSKFLRRTNVWTDITEILRGKTHSAQKPDALYCVLIETHSKPGDCVFDPCAGSGTTARAAQACGRGSYLIELKGGQDG